MGIWKHRISQVKDTSSLLVAKTIETFYFRKESEKEKKPSKFFFWRRSFRKSKSLK